MNERTKTDISIQRAAIDQLDKRRVWTSATAQAGRGRRMWMFQPPRMQARTSDSRHLDRKFIEAAKPALADGTAIQAEFRQEHRTTP